MPPARKGSNWRARRNGGWRRCHLPFLSLSPQPFVEFRIDVVKAFKQLAGGPCDRPICKVRTDIRPERYPFAIDGQQMVEPLPKLFLKVGKQSPKAGPRLFFLTVAPQQIDDLDPAERSLFGRKNG